MTLVYPDSETYLISEKKAMPLAVLLASMIYFGIAAS